jgi:hypothetical protein
LVEFIIGGGVLRLPNVGPVVLENVPSISERFAIRGWSLWKPQTIDALIELRKKASAGLLNPPNLFGG